MRMSALLACVSVPYVQGVPVESRGGWGLGSSVSSFSCRVDAGNKQISSALHGLAFSLALRNFETRFYTIVQVDWNSLYSRDWP